MNTPETKNVPVGSAELPTTQAQEPFTLTALTDGEEESLAVDVARTAYQHRRLLTDPDRSQVAAYFGPMGIWLCSYNIDTAGKRVTDASLSVACRPGIPDNPDDYARFRRVARRVAEILAEGTDTSGVKILRNRDKGGGMFSVRVVTLPGMPVESVTYSWPVQPGTAPPQKF